MYGYRDYLLVDETFKAFADSVCKEFELQYPPLSHADTLYLYYVRMIVKTFLYNMYIFGDFIG